MATWREDTIQALKNLGGVAHLSEIHKEVARLRKGKLNNTWTQTIQRELETYSSDSDVWKTKLAGKEDLFYMAEGKGKGVWGLRNYQNESSLSEIIKKISNGWLEYRDHCKSTAKNGASIRIVKQDHFMYDLVKTDWARFISKNVNLKKYTVESSVGQGNISAAPWLTVMDKSITESATEGFYVVYLFSRSAKKLYLSIGIGATQFQEIYGLTKLCLDKIQTANSQFKNLFKKYEPPNTINSINLLEDDLDFEEPIKGSARNLVSCYEKGTNFSKEYNIDQLDEEILIKDLEEYINIYANIVNDPNAESLDIIAETTIDEKIETKKEISTDYDIPIFSPRDNKNKKPRKISTVVLSKKKRRTQQSKKIGLAGENHVYKYEYDKLIKLNKKDLADKIIKHFEIYEYPGWDITSYDKEGNEIFIEVKSTKGTSINQIEITSNEWDAAIKQKQDYNIYLVNNALNDKIKIFEKINNPAKLVEDKKIEISTSVFELKF